MKLPKPVNPNQPAQAGIPSNNPLPPPARAKSQVDELFLNKSPAVPQLSPVDFKRRLSDRLGLSTGWLVATAVVCLLGMAMILAVYFSK